MTDPTIVHAEWGSLSGLPLDRIWNARLQVHHALQIPAALHTSRYTPRDDQSHTAFRVERGDFVSLGDSAVPWRAALRTDTLTVDLLDGVGDVAGAVSLEGRTRLHLRCRSSRTAHGRPRVGSGRLFPFGRWRTTPRRVAVRALAPSSTSRSPMPVAC